MSKRRQLVLVGLDWLRPKDPPVSLGNACIAAHCSPVCDVRTVSLNVNTGDHKATYDHNEALLGQGLEDITKQVHSERPVVGVGAYIWAEHLVNPLVARIKAQWPKSVVVLGGPQISYSPNDGVTHSLSETYPQCDGFVKGYGEKPMRKLMEFYNTPQYSDVKSDFASFETIDGFIPFGHFCKNTVNKQKDKQTAFDGLESPLLSGWLKPQSFLRWETQRGCPFKCAFCQHRDGSGQRSALSRTRVAAECEHLCELSRGAVLRDLAVIDPTFNSEPSSVNTLDTLRRGGFCAKISLQCRLELMNDAFFEAVCRLHESGARVQLEFGIQTVVKSEMRAIDRPTLLRKAERWLQRINGSAVPYELTFIYGLPFQTLESFQRSVDWAAHFVSGHSQGEAVAKFWPLMLLRGTPLWEQRQRYGLQTSDNVAVDISDRVKSGIPHVVSSDTFSFEDWLRMNRIAEDFEFQSLATARTTPKI